MATLTSFKEQCKNKEADWRIKGRKFNWLKFRFQTGWHCYVVYPTDGAPDKYWWEWDN